MKYYLLIILALSVPVVFSQFGIKTHQPQQQPPQGHFIVHNASGPIIIHRPIQPWNGTYNKNNEKDLFINKTLSGIATGVCFKEVPTASLVKNTNEIPAGNGSDPTLSRIQICCEGYERNMHNFRKCDPICKNDCVNGICTAPDVCECFPDHIRNLAGYCLPTCPIGCGNGECLPDGRCQCKPGYILEPRSQKFCIPFCKEGCQFGNCTEPEICNCNEGYRLTPENKCVPKCDNCAYGECVAPGTCKCNPGYTRTNGKCEPVCQRGCKNGICTAPNTCSCKTGFNLDASGINCVPHCEFSCLNGFCGGNNMCTCNEGYKLDETNPSICKPNCPGGCPNGFCTSPNFCICKPGFIKSGIKGRQTCIPLNK